MSDHDEAGRSTPRTARFSLYRCPVCDGSLDRGVSTCRHCGSALRTGGGAGRLLLALALLVAGAGLWTLRGGVAGGLRRAPAPASRDARGAEPATSPEAPPATRGAGTRPAPGGGLTRVLAGTVRIEAGESTGSGFFVAPDRILTAAHVVEGISNPEVHLPGGASVVARKVTRLPKIDIAVLELPQKYPLAVPVGDASSLRAAQPVMACGHPLGLTTSTVTRGVVSAAPVRLPNQEGVLIQVDAPINPGNSGGPLVDGSGAVVGILTAKVMGAEGMGFATPVNYAAELDGIDSLPSSPAFATWAAQPAAMVSVSFATPEALEIVGAAWVEDGLMVFLTVKDAAGARLVVPLALTIRAEVDEATCVGSHRVPRSAWSGGPALARKHGVARDDAPVVGVTLPCQRRGTASGSIRIHAQSEGIASARREVRL